MSLLQRFSFTKLASIYVEVSDYFSWSIAGLFYYQLLLMGKNREDSVKTAGGNHFSRAETLSRLMTILSLLVGLEEGETKGRETLSAYAVGMIPDVSKSIVTQRFLFFSSFAFCHLPSLCSLLKCPSRQFALCFGLQESTLQSCVDPICDMAFDFALHLCTS